VVSLGRRTSGQARIVGVTSRVSFRAHAVGRMFGDSTSARPHRAARLTTRAFRDRRDMSADLRRTKNDATDRDIDTAPAVSAADCVTLEIR